MGFEPTTSRVTAARSTAELHRNTVKKATARGVKVLLLIKVEYYENYAETIVALVDDEGALGKHYDVLGHDYHAHH